MMVCFLITDIMGGALNKEALLIILWWSTVFLTEASLRSPIHHLPTPQIKAGLTVFQPYDERGGCRHIFGHIVLRSDILDFDILSFFKAFVFKSFDKSLAAIIKWRMIRNLRDAYLVNLFRRRLILRIRRLICQTSAKHRNCQQSCRSNWNYLFNIFSLLVFPIFLNFPLK